MFMSSLEYYPEALSLLFNFIQLYESNLQSFGHNETVDLFSELISKLLSELFISSNLRLIFESSGLNFGKKGAVNYSLLKCLVDEFYWFQVAINCLGLENANELSRQHLKENYFNLFEGRSKIWSYIPNIVIEMTKDNTSLIMIPQTTDMDCVYVTIYLNGFTKLCTTFVDAPNSTGYQSLYHIVCTYISKLYHCIYLHGGDGRLFVMIVYMYIHLFHVYVHSNWPGG